MLNAYPDESAFRIYQQQTLETIERSHLFLVALDDRRQWFRYHHLFTDALRSQLTASEPDRPAQLHRAAAHWYAGEGMLDDAIGHALAAGESDYAAAFVAERQAQSDWISDRLGIA